MKHASDSETLINQLIAVQGMPHLSLDGISALEFGLQINFCNEVLDQRNSVYPERFLIEPGNNPCYRRISGNQDFLKWISYDLPCKWMSPDDL